MHARLDINIGKRCDAHVDTIDEHTAAFGGRLYSHNARQFAHGKIMRLRRFVIDHKGYEFVMKASHTFNLLDARHRPH